MKDKMDESKIRFPKKNVPYENHRAVFIPWDGLRNAAAERIGAVIGRPVTLKIDIEEYDWWAFSIKNTKITPYEMQLLFIAFNADEQDVLDHGTDPAESSAMYSPTAYFGDRFSLKIVRDLIPIRTIAASIAAPTGLWAIEARSGANSG